MVLDLRPTRPAPLITWRRSFLPAVTGLGVIGAPALAYGALRSQIGLGSLLLVAVGALGLFVPPDRLVALMAPAWLFAPMSAQALSLARAATWALAVGLLLRFVSGALPVRRAVVWLALFAAVLIVSLLHPAIAGSALISPWSDLVGVLCGLMVAAVAISAPPRPWIVAKAIAVAGALAAAFTLAAGQTDGGRLVTEGLNTNYLAAMMALPCIAALGLARYARQPAWLVVAAPCAVAVLQTYSRGALIAVAAGVGYLLLTNRTGRQRALIVAAAALMPVLFGGFLTGLLFGARTTTELDANNAIRGDALRLALQVALEHPLRGIGYNMFPLYATDAPQIGYFINTHNDFVRLACEAGLPALAVFCMLLILAMRGRRGGSETVLRAVVVSYAVSLLFGNFLSSMVVSVPFWLALGCLLAGGGEPPPARPARRRTAHDPAAGCRDGRRKGSRHAR